MWRENFGARLLVTAAEAAVFFFINFRSCHCQNLPAAILDGIEQMAQEGGDPEAGVKLEQYSYWISNPLKINCMSRRKLISTGLFSPFQAASVIEYRSVTGDILSAAELAMLDGFDAGTVSRISPFIDFSTDYAAGQARDSTMRVESEIRLRSVFKLQDSSPSALLRYKGSAGESWEWGLTAEQDAGEPLADGWRPDFLSGGICWWGDRLSVFAGDFRARFGQGLVVSKSFQGSFAAAPSSLCRNANSFSRYSSTDEYNFFRGIGASLSAGRREQFTFSVFASANTVDARVKDGRYTSISTSGYHDTPTLIAARRTMYEFAGGFNAFWCGDGTRIGLTAIAYGYNRHNGRKAQEYNILQMYDGIWGNAGCDFLSVIGDFRLFGEFAVDPGLSPAALAGAVWSPSYGTELGLLLRAYSPGYTATHAGAYSTLSSCSNQFGATISAALMPSAGWSLTFQADAAYHPHARYRIPNPSGRIKGSALLSREGGAVGITIKAAADWQSNLNALKATAYATVSWHLCRLLTLSSRASGVLAPDGTAGYAVYQQASLGLKHLQISARVTFHSTDGWDSRIYLYEQNLPGTFASKAYYGRGWNAYLMVTYSNGKSLRADLRLCDSGISAQTTFSF